MDVKDIVGKRFGNLVVLEYNGSNISITGKRKRKITRHFYKCKCECGKEKIINRSSLVSGKTKSCGCLRDKIAKEIRKKHGLSDTRFQRILNGMKQRCYNKKSSHYNCYGGRGIKICDEWKNNIENFYNWAIKNGYRDDLTIDRIDVNGNYCPENCRWINQKQQCRNQRRNVKYNFNGKKMCLTEISEIYYIPVETLLSRLNNGMTIEEAIIKKVRKNFRILYKGNEYNLYRLCKKLGLSYKSVHERYRKGNSLTNIIKEKINIIQEPYLRNNNFLIL